MNGAVDAAAEHELPVKGDPDLKGIDTLHHTFANCAKSRL